MLSPDERKLLAGLLLLLLLGGVVRSCRHQVTVDQTPKADLPSVEEEAPRTAPAPD